MMTTEIKSRTSFVKGETLNEDESYTVEYKDYLWPSDPFLKSKWIRTINSFLNRRGGRIYIGITDTHIVKGIKLTMKERDELKLYLYGLLDTFDPPIKNKELVNVHFIPIFNPGKRGKAIPGLFIVKIIVRQGDPSVLYSTSNENFEVYLRNDAQSVRLKVNEITENILKRNRSPEAKVPSSEFNDPKPEPLVDIDVNKIQQPENKKQELSRIVQTYPNQENETLVQKKSKQQKRKKKSDINTVQKMLPINPNEIPKFSQGKSENLITYQHYSSVSQQQIGVASY
jgi:predicted HTH transcriptional regulator